MNWLRRYGDLTVGVVVAIAGVVVVATQDLRGPAWADVLVMLALGGLLAARSRAPLAAAYGFVALLLIMSAGLVTLSEAVVVFFGLILFSYSAGTARRPALAVCFMPTLTAAIVVAGVTTHGSTAGDYVFPMAISLAAYGAGRNAVVRGALAAELHEAELRAEEVQAAEARRAVAAERRRIAREMHDVVAHSISIMVVQAGGARRIIDRDPERAATAAGAIEATGRDTLIEMRRLLGVMHPGEAPAELEPSPSLSDLASLCRRFEAELRVVGHAQPLPSGLEIGAYRVVQEALEDRLRGPHVSVTVEWTPLALTVHIVDDRPFGVTSELVGVRERVDLYGGTATVGRVGGLDSGDGQQLEVRFPINDDVLLQGASPQ